MNTDKSISDEKEQIELRSENTRKFISEEPPLFIRIGTVVITLLIIVITVFTAYHVKVGDKSLWQLIFP